MTAVVIQSLVDRVADAIRLLAHAARQHAGRLADATSQEAVATALAIARSRAAACVANLPVQTHGVLV